MVPASLQTLLQELERLPGVGPRTAERLAFHLLTAPEEQVRQLADALLAVKSKLRPCRVCGMVSEQDECAICADPRRDRSLVCVVEQPRDLYAIERLGVYDGTYHVLMGTVSLLDGIGLEDLQLEPLARRLEAGGVREVVLATNPNLEGESTAVHLAQWLRRFGVRVSRLARGVAAGTTLETASRGMIEDALLERRELHPPSAPR